MLNLQMKLEKCMHSLEIMSRLKFASSYINSARLHTIASSHSAKGDRGYNHAYSLRISSYKFHSSIDNNLNTDITEKKEDNINKTRRSYDFRKGPDLADFIIANSKSIPALARHHPYLKRNPGFMQKIYFDIFGCQMNFNDTEIIWSILKENGYSRTLQVEDANIILIVTCAIREGAEQKVWSRINQFSALKKKRRQLQSTFPLRIGVLGCMAERLKTQILEKNKAVHLVAGPDSYRDLPRLLSIVENHETAVNVALSFEETYADITPVRLNPDAVSAFVSIMRGCDNMCTYCIVPFVRGRERSRPLDSILNEVKQLSDQGIREVTLLGQNVNSYRDLSESTFYTGSETPTNLTKGFRTVYKNKLGGRRFADLLDKISIINPEMRIRFTSPHPKDFPDEVLHLIAERSNICKQMHLPAQSGNSAVLERMRRGYTRESYLELVEHIRSIIPEMKLSSDFIAGFCDETDDEFDDTITLIDRVKYHQAFVFQYSMREKTTAHRKFQDNVPHAIKNQRLMRMLQLWRGQAEKLNRLQVGTHQLVLIEGPSRKVPDVFQGRTDGNTRVIIPNSAIPSGSRTDVPRNIKHGDYIVAQICGSNSNSLMGIPLYHSTISEFTEKINTSRTRI